MCKTIIAWGQGNYVYSIVNLLAIRSELLRAWKDQNGLNATYANLLKACVQTNNADAANTIVELLKGNHNSKLSGLCRNCLAAMCFNTDGQCRRY